MVQSTQRATPLILIGLCVFAALGQRLNEDAQVLFFFLGGPARLGQAFWRCSKATRSATARHGRQEPIAWPGCWRRA